MRRLRTFACPAAGAAHPRGGELVRHRTVPVQAPEGGGEREGFGAANPDDQVPVPSRSSSAMYSKTSPPCPPAAAVLIRIAPSRHLLRQS
jgi:hypothetical protein